MSYCSVMYICTLAVYICVQAIKANHSILHHACNYHYFLLPLLYHDMLKETSKLSLPTHLSVINKELWETVDNSAV